MLIKVLSLVQDTHDLFATLMVSLELKNNSRFFRTYSNSFTTDDAATNLASLRFSQSNRTVDPQDSARIITTTTTTTFSMSREIAKGICQHFMDARLIENAADHLAVAFKERGIYQITPKGLHVLERFITRNGIASDNLVKVFVSQPMCMKLINLERTIHDDDLIISKPIIESIFRRFAGARQPNYIVDPTEASRGAQLKPFVENARPPPGYDRSLGVELQDVCEKGKGSSLTVYKQVFGSQAGVDWLLDYSTCVCRDEAAELIGHFVRLGLVALHSDRSKSGDKLVLVEVKSDSGPGLRQAEFRWGTRVTYRITEEGRKLAAANQRQAAAAEAAEAQKANESGSFGGKSSEDDIDRKGARQRTSSDPMGNALSNAVDRQHLTPRQIKDIFNSDDWSKEAQSSTNRLRAILEESMLRGMFREYLRSNYCDENLGFWLDVSEFRRRFSTTSSASGGGAGGAKSKPTSAGATSAMEVHQQHLVAAAMQIYHTYLAPMSPNELNIDHNLRGDVVNFIQKAQLDNAASGDTPVQMKKLTASADGASEGGETVPTIALRATQVQTLLRHYERIQDHIFRLLATDQVPKVSAPMIEECHHCMLTSLVHHQFIRGPKFQAVLKEADDAIEGEKSSPLHVKA